MFVGAAVGPTAYRTEVQDLLADDTCPFANRDQACSARSSQGGNSYVKVRHGHRLRRDHRVLTLLTEVGLSGVSCGPSGRAAPRTVLMCTTALDRLSHSLVGGDDHQLDALPEWSMLAKQKHLPRSELPAIAP